MPAPDRGETALRPNEQKPSSYRSHAQEIDAIMATRARKFAEQLVACEAASRGLAAKDALAFGYCEKLRGPLAKLLGIAGFNSLMSRALALAGAEISWLRELRVKVDGSLAGVSEIEAKLGARVVAEGEVVLVGHLVGLLALFIGPSSTQALLHDIWSSRKTENTEFQAL